MKVKVNSSGSSALKVASFVMIVFTLISIMFVKAGIDKKEGALVIVGFGVFAVVAYFLYLTFKRPIRLNAILTKKNKMKLDNKEIINLTFQINDEYAPEYVGGIYYCTLEEEIELIENSNYIVEVKEFTRNIESIYTNNEPSFVKQNIQPKTNYLIENITLNNLTRTSILYFIIWISLTCLYFACNLKSTSFKTFEIISILVLIILQSIIIISIIKNSDKEKKVIKKLNLKLDKIKPSHNYNKYKINKYIKNSTLDSYLVINSDNTLLYKVQRLTPLNNNYVISNSSDEIVGDITMKDNKYLIRMKNRKLHFAKILTKGTILLDETYQFTKIYYGKGYKISDKKGNILCKIKPYEKKEKYAYKGSSIIELNEDVNNNDQIMLLSIIGTILKEK